jgi:hypothetical protein
VMRTRSARRLVAPQRHNAAECFNDRGTVALRSRAHAGGPQRVTHRPALPVDTSRRMVGTQAFMKTCRLCSRHSWRCAAAKGGVSRVRTRCLGVPVVCQDRCASPIFPCFSWFRG